MNKIYKFMLYCIVILKLENSLIAIESSPLTINKSISVNAFENLDPFVNEVLDIFNVPGSAIGIVIEGKAVFAKGYGYRNLEQKLPVTENTLFAIGSCTKAFTSFMLGQLVNEEKLNWDDPVINHIPEFRLVDPYSTYHTTIRDLVAHRSGVARHDLLWLNPQFTRSDIIRALRFLEPACKLREKFVYNNLMYAVAGILIEKITRQTWEEALSSRIFTPLNMLNSNSSVNDSLESEDFSLPYADIADEIKVIPFRNIHSCAPAGAINSSVSDMVKWIQLQLSDGTLFDKHFINKETLQEMHTIQMPMVSSTPDDKVYNFGYGLGWCTGFYRGHYYLHHCGGIDGFISQVSLLPQEKIGIVVLTNDSSSGEFVVSCITNTIIDKLLEETKIDWLERSKNERERIQQESSDQNIEPISTPAHRLEDYVGDYEHPAYGIIRVKLENNQLFAIYGELIASLSCKCNNTFYGKMDDKMTIIFSFASNASDDICELSIPLEKTVKPIIFKR